MRDSWLFRVPPGALPIMSSARKRGGSHISPSLPLPFHPQLASWPENTLKSICEKGKWEKGSRGETDKEQARK